MIKWERAKKLEIKKNNTHTQRNRETKEKIPETPRFSERLEELSEDLAELRPQAQHLQLVGQEMARRNT